MDFTFLVNSMVTGLFVGVGSAFGTEKVKVRYFIVL
jgi:hypothetical protein